MPEQQAVCLKTPGKGTVSPAYQRRECHSAYLSVRERPRSFAVSWPLPGPPAREDGERAGGLSAPYRSIRAPLRQPQAAERRGAQAEPTRSGTAHCPLHLPGPQGPRGRVLNQSGDSHVTWARSTEATRLSCRVFWMWSQDRLRLSQGAISLRMEAQRSWSCSGQVGRQRVVWSRSTHVFSSLGRPDRVACHTTERAPASQSSPGPRRIGPGPLGRWRERYI